MWTPFDTDFDVHCLMDVALPGACALGVLHPVSCIRGACALGAALCFADSYNAPKTPPPKLHERCGCWFYPSHTFGVSLIIAGRLMCQAKRCQKRNPPPPCGAKGRRMRAGGLAGLETGRKTPICVVFSDAYFRPSPICSMSRSSNSCLEWTPTFVYRWRAWLRTVFSEMHRLSAM